MATTPQVKKALLSALTGQPSRLTLGCAEFYLTDTAVRAEAQAAVKKIKAGIRKRSFKATASHNAKAAKNAIDGNRRTRWDSGQPMRPGSWFMIDMGSKTDFKGLKLIGGLMKLI